MQHATSEIVMVTAAESIYKLNLCCKSNEILAISQEMQLKT